MSSRKTSHRCNIVKLLNSRSLGEASVHKNGCHGVDDHLQQIAEDQVVGSVHDERVCKLPANVKSTFLMAFSPDKTKVASTHGDHKIYVSDIQTGKCLHVLEGHPRTPWCIAFHPSYPNVLASGCLGGEVRVWELHGGSEVWVSPRRTVIASLAFHPIQKYLAVATYNEIYFWDWRHPAPFWKCNTPSEREKVRYIKFDLFGQYLITGITNRTGIANTPRLFTANRSRDEPLLRESGSRRYVNSLRDEAQILRDQVMRMNNSSRDVQRPGSSRSNALPRRTQWDVRFVDNPIEEPTMFAPESEDDDSSAPEDDREATNQNERPMSPVHAAVLDQAEEYIRQQTIDFFVSGLRSQANENSDAPSSSSQNAAPASDNSQPSSAANSSNENRSESSAAQLHQELMHSLATLIFRIMIRRRTNQGLFDQIPESLRLFFAEYCGGNISGNLADERSIADLQAQVPSIDSVLNQSEPPEPGEFGESADSRDGQSDGTGAAFADPASTLSQTLIYTIRQLRCAFQVLIDPQMNDTLNRIPNGRTRMLRIVTFIINRYSNLIQISGMTLALPNIQQDLIQETSYICSQFLLLLRSPDGAESGASGSSSASNASATRLNHVMVNLLHSLERIVSLEFQYRHLRLMSSAVVSSPMPASSLNWRDERTVTILPNPFSQENIQDPRPPLNPSQPPLINTHNNSAFTVLRRRRENFANSERPHQSSNNSGDNIGAIRFWNCQRRLMRQIYINSPIPPRLNLNDILAADELSASNQPDDGLNLLANSAAASLDNVEVSERFGNSALQNELINQDLEFDNTDLNYDASANENNLVEDLMDAALTIQNNSNSYSSASDSNAGPSNIASNLSSLRNSTFDLPNPLLRVPRLQIDHVEGADTSDAAGGSNRPRSPPLGHVISSAINSLPDPYQSFPAPSLSRNENSGGVTIEPSFLHANYTRGRMWDDDSSYNRHLNTVQRFELHRLLPEARGPRALFGEILTHRIQRWKFVSPFHIDLSSATSSVVVSECKIHNDASVDIAADGTILVAIVPSCRDGIILGVYSLQDHNLGQCLHKYSFNREAITVSLSPLSRYILVGLASCRFGTSPFSRSQIMCKIFKIEWNAKHRELIVIRCLNHYDNVTSRRQYVSLNSAFWLPKPGDGIIYGTNRGDLRIRYPKYGGNDYLNVEFLTERQSHSSENRQSSAGIQTATATTTGTQTTQPNSHSIATQTSNQDYI